MFVGEVGPEELRIEMEESSGGKIPADVSEPGPVNPYLAYAE